MKFRALVNNLSVITGLIMVTIFLVWPSAALAANQPGLELRTNQPLFLNQAERIELTIVVVDAINTNVSSLKFETTGGLKIVDIVPEPNFLSLNKQILNNSAQIDIAKTDIFTNEEPLGVMIVEMIGVTSGEIMLSGGSVVGNSHLGPETKVEVKFLGGTKIPANQNLTFSTTLQTVGIAVVVILTIGLLIYLQIYKSNRRKAQKSQQIVLA
jgi:hypothetical protein